MSEAVLANLYATVHLCRNELPPDFQDAVTAIVSLLENNAQTIDPKKELFASYVDRLVQAVSSGARLYRRDFEHPLVATQALYLVYGEPISWTDFSRLLTKKSDPKETGEAAANQSETDSFAPNTEYASKGAGLYKNWSPLVRSILVTIAKPTDRSLLFAEMQRLSPTKPPPTYALSHLLHHMWQKKEITMAGSSPQKWCLEPGLPAEMLRVFTEDGSYEKPAAEPQRRADRPPTKKELIIGFVREKGERTNSEMMEFCTRFGARDKIDMWDICNAIVELEPVKVPMGVYGDTRTAGYKLRSALNA